MLLGAGLLILSNGAWMVPIAAWLGPLFLVRFIRTQPVVRGLALGYLVSTVVFAIQWYAVFSMAVPSLIGGIAVLFGLVTFLPYVADRLLVDRIGGFAGSLVFPMSWVAVEFLLHLISPMPTFFSIGYTQHGNLPLLQLLSVTGLWGICFLIAWNASVANYLWERLGDWSSMRRGVAIYAAVLGSVLLVGGLRMAAFPPSGERVKVAMITSDTDIKELGDRGSDESRRLHDGRPSPGDLAEIRGRIASTNDNLFEKTRLQARAGARVVVWNEYDAHILSMDEDAFVQRAGTVARSEHIHLAILLIVVEPRADRRSGPDHFVINKALLFEPSGELAFEYVKANLFVGWESAHADAGPRELRSVDSPVGRLATAICFDLDHPGFVRQAGRQGVDIMLAGALDGPPGNTYPPVHSLMAPYRAVENGMSLARGGQHGLSLAVDYQGRTLASMPHRTADGRSIVAHLPIRGVHTVYSVIGDTFAWLCIAGLGVLVALAAVRRTTRAG